MYRRYGHTCTCTRIGTLICHAGSSSSIYHYKSTYIFDPKTSHFSQVESHPEMAARQFHAVAYVERPYPETDLLFMYGGYAPGDSEFKFNDLWMMNTNMTNVTLGKELTP